MARAASCGPSPAGCRAGEGAWVPAALKGLSVLALSSLPHPGPWLVHPYWPTLPKPYGGPLSPLHDSPCLPSFLLTPIPLSTLPRGPGSLHPQVIQASLFPWP